ncbi:hypothetical protein P154DRAFT_534539 [Amniculicola lignicola CBS 123094]|uniref:Uncharacterized protein n=1 Tax=Amniculicola lignicola CBS 123094 TaxID=1392246 RepID=A0A6A5WH52_9PLEO|nr:hypothetical protein P154DRAFT_534539 [Amniculicola lignicola CBS 123094]
MAPQPLPPTITPPPTLPLRPRQSTDPNDPYGLSSLYAELSSMYPELYSTYSYDFDSAMSSIWADLSTYGFSYSIPDSYDLSSALASLTAAPVTGTAGRVTGTAALSRETSTSSSSSKGGLSTAGKIGIAVAVPVVVFALIGVGIFLWCAGKKKGKKTGTTIVNPPMKAEYMQPAATQAPFQAQPYMGNQGYMAGYAKPQGPLPVPTPTPPPQYVPQQQYAPGAQQPYLPPQAQGQQYPPQPAQGQQYPPQQPQGQQAQEQNVYAAGGYAKGPDDNIAELGQEYQFARPGVVELGDGVAEEEPKKKSRWRGN